MVHRLLELFTDHQVGAASHALLLEAPQPERQNSLFLLFSRFSPDLLNSAVFPGLKARLDLSAEYLILTDVQRKVRADPPGAALLSPRDGAPHSLTIAARPSPGPVRDGAATGSGRRQGLLHGGVSVPDDAPRAQLWRPRGDLQPPAEHRAPPPRGGQRKPLHGSAHTSCHPYFNVVFFSVSECPRPSFKVNCCFLSFQKAIKGPRSRRPVS